MKAKRTKKKVQGRTNKRNYVPSIRINILLFAALVAVFTGCGRGQKNPNSEPIKSEPLVENNQVLIPKEVELKVEAVASVRAELLRSLESHCQDALQNNSDVKGIANSPKSKNPNYVTKARNHITQALSEYVSLPSAITSLRRSKVIATDFLHAAFYAEQSRWGWSPPAYYKCFFAREILMLYAKTVFLDTPQASYFLTSRVNYTPAQEYVHGEVSLIYIETLKGLADLSVAKKDMFTKSLSSLDIALSAWLENHLTRIKGEKQNRTNLVDQERFVQALQVLKKHTGDFLKLFPNQFQKLNLQFQEIK